MKTFVTGCAGFIGSHLVDMLLEQGYEVIGIDCFTDYYSREIKEMNISNALNRNNFEFIEEDILNLDKFPEVDYIFHLAAQAGVRASWGKSFGMYTRNNIEATQKLLEFYKDRAIKKFVYASSSSVYGDAELPMREDSLLKPVSPYGVTKLAGENLCYLYWKNYGVPTISLRYFTVYGPRQRPDMAIHKFVKAILNDKEILIFGDGAQTRDFTFVDDAVEANILAAENDSVGGVFNIGGGSRISVNALIDEIEKIAGNKANIRNIEKQKGDVLDTRADVSKAKEMLTWKPKVKIEEGLKRFVEWFMSASDKTDSGTKKIAKKSNQIHHQRVVTFITARMGSTRLPRKHLLQIMGKPVIEHLIERVKQAKLPQQAVLCTTILPEDDVLDQIAKKAGILAFRGYPTDILMRWLKAAELYHVDFIVSADGDDVFCDPEHIDKVVEHFLETNADYITCRGLPFGASPTGIKVEALRKVCKLKSDDDTEGQSRYFTQTGLFRVEYIDITDPELHHPEIRMTLDYSEDFNFFNAVFQHLYQAGKVFTLSDIVKLLEQHPEIVQLNQDMQKKYEERFQSKYKRVKLKQE